jgi:hypothetical protein
MVSRVASASIGLRRFGRGAAQKPHSMHIRASLAPSFLLVLGNHQSALDLWAIIDAQLEKGSPQPCIEEHVNFQTVRLVVPSVLTNAVERLWA